MKNRKLLIGFIGILALLAGCTNPESMEKKEYKKISDAVVKIYAHGVSDDAKYRVYINNRDTNRTLGRDVFTKFYVPKGRLNLQIVKKRETASIDMRVEANQIYTLNIFNDASNHIELMQVPNNSRK